MQCAVVNGRVGVAVLALAAFLAACTREVSQPERAEPVAPAPVPPNSAGPDASPVFGWGCDDGVRFVTRYDGASGALELAGGQEVERLASVRAASGARWQRGDVVFHNRGGEALLTRGTVTARCEIDPVTTAEARAALAGSLFRGIGSAPDWSLDIRSDRVLWVGEWGAERRRFLDPVRSGSGPLRWYGQDETGAITVSVDESECRDGGGRSYPATVSVDLEGRRLEGCGRWLEAAF